jgi:hypothetical protein
MLFEIQYECTRKDLPNVLPDDLKNIVVDFARFIPRPTAEYYRRERHRVMRNFIFRFNEESFNRRFLDHCVIPLFCVEHYNKNPNFHNYYLYEDWILKKKRFKFFLIERFGVSLIGGRFPINIINTKTSTKETDPKSNVLSIYIYLFYIFKNIYKVKYL